MLTSRLRDSVDDVSSQLAAQLPQLVQVEVLYVHREVHGILHPASTVAAVERSRASQAAKKLHSMPHSSLCFTGLQFAYQQWC